MARIAGMMMKSHFLKRCSLSERLKIYICFIEKLMRVIAKSPMGLAKACKSRMLLLMRTYTNEVKQTCKKCKLLYVFEYE